MSIFIGKENGKPLLHLTRGYTDLSIIKGQPTTNTVLHSDINYTGFQVFDPDPSEYAYTHGSDGMYEIAITLSNSPTMTLLKNYLFGSATGNRRTFIAFVNDTIQMNRAVEVDQSYGGLLTTGTFVYSDGRSRQNNWLPSTRQLGIRSQNPMNSLYFVAFDVDIKGVDTLDSFRFSRTSIEITKNTFNVGGVELSSVPFLCFGELMNSIDYQGKLSGGMRVQFINSVATPGNYQLSLMNGRGLIKKGTKTIADTYKDLAISGIQNTQNFSKNVWEFRGGSSVTLGYIPSEGVYLFTATITNSNGILSAASTLGVIRASEPVDVIVPIMTINMRVTQGTMKITASNTNSSSTWYTGTVTLMLTATRIL